MLEILMISPVEIGWATAITVAAIICIPLVVFGLPGGWIMVAIAAAMTFSASSTAAYAMAWPTLATLVVIAACGEVVETVAGAAKVKQLGGSRRAGYLAIAGSIAGAIVGFIIGSPVPIIGSIAVSLMCGCIGAFCGAAVGELWAGQKWDQAYRVAMAALTGRFLGTIGKIIATTMIASILIAAAWL